MKRGILILSLSMLILLALVSSACGGSSATPTPAQPRIYFYEDSVDVGKVPLDVPQKYTFRFKNVGGEALVILSVEAKALEGC